MATGRRSGIFGNVFLIHFYFLQNYTECFAKYTKWREKKHIIAFIVIFQQRLTDNVNQNRRETTKPSAAKKTRLLHTPLRDLYNWMRNDDVWDEVNLMNFATKQINNEHLTRGREGKRENTLKNLKTNVMRKQWQHKWKDFQNVFCHSAALSLFFSLFHLFVICTHFDYILAMKS